MRSWLTLCLSLLVVIALSSALHAGSAHAKTEPQLLIPNLRSQRQPVRPWQVAAGPFVATVKAWTLSSSFASVTWKLDVRLTGPSQSWTLVSATTDTTETEIVRYDREAGEANDRSLVLHVTAPRMCSADQLREQVVVKLRYRVAGRLRSVSMTLDERCLLGDVVEQESAARFERLADGYRRDPVIEALVAHADVGSERSLGNDIRKLKEWLAFGEHSVQPDPPNIAKSWERGTPYALSPNETARLGGDCEDWSILVTAYLKRLGYKARIADNAVHVWVTVVIPGEPQPVVVDLVKEIEQATSVQ